MEWEISVPIMRHLTYESGNSGEKRRTKHPSLSLPISSVTAQYCCEYRQGADECYDGPGSNFVIGASQQVSSHRIAGSASRSFLPSLGDVNELVEL